MKKIAQSLGRIALLLVIILGIVFGGYWFWSPGLEVNDGRFDLQQNGIWLQHGWLGSDVWFKRNQRDKNKFRSAEKIDELFVQLEKYHIKYIYPHLCPTAYSGEIPNVDSEQTKMFLQLSEKYKIKTLPWVGGVFGGQVMLSSKKWRANFVQSIMKLLEKYPRMAGIQLNIEPLPDKNKDFILLLKELRAVFPKDKILSIAAYPPPTRLHQYKTVHWSMEYYSQMAPYVDQMAVMMYDTAIKYDKFYVSLMTSWTKQLLNNSELQKYNVKLLLGLPAYNDAHTAYHNPKVENLKNALLGINNALNSQKNLKKNYQGTAIYCEWEMDSDKWKIYQKNFLKK